METRNTKSWQTLKSLKTHKKEKASFYQSDISQTIERISSRVTDWPKSFNNNDDDNDYSVFLICIKRR